MDIKDQQILKLLGDDARLPMKTIAAAVGLARSSVRERIHKLETAGVIRSYRAKLADDPQSGIGVRAFGRRRTWRSAGRQGGDADDR